MKKTGIFIPGRLASERLPNKLILPIVDTCLWDIACNKLDNLPDNINKYVLCYDTDLLDIASKYKNLKTIRRDSTTTSVDGPLTYIFKELKTVPDKYLMFLNPCLSLLKPETILSAIDHFNRNKFEYCTSVREFKNWVWAVDKTPVIPIDYKTLSTKSIPKHYEAAHCFHIFNKDDFFKTGNMLTNDLDLFEIPGDQLLDVDTIEDYNYLRWYYEQFN